MRVPEYAGGGRVIVDATWGTIQPHAVAPGVRTIGELELIEHLRAGRVVVDTRGPDSHALATIPGAVGIPHDAIVDRVAELGDGPVALFCNGPQCPATPKAVRALLDHGVRPERLLYYRGGIHDWMTLGLPIDGTRSVADDHGPKGPQPMGIFSRLRARRLTPDEAVADPDLLIVDVRSPDEYRSGHAPGAVNLPLGTLEQRLGDLEARDRSLAFICHSGARSAMAVRAARRAGLDGRNISGGMLAWSRAGLPVESGRGGKRRR